jgi:hypothetical protein
LFIDADRAKFKQVVPFTHPDLVARIQQNYRLQYIKDAALLRHLDESSVAMITHAVFFNNMTLVNQLSTDDDFLRDLFSAMLRLPEGSGKDTLTIFWNSLSDGSHTGFDRH